MKKLNQSAKFLIGITIMLLTVNITLGTVLFKQSSSALLSIIQKRMLDVSNIAASIIDGNVLEKITTADINKEEYQTVLNTLKHFKNNSELSYIYCVRDNGDKKFTFIVDPSEEDPGEFGSPVVYTDALYKASLGTPAADQIPYEDNWGIFYSAYSPVFNSTGKVTGIVVVDFDAEWYNNQLLNLILTIVITIIISILAGFSMILLFININRKRIRNVYEQLEILTSNVKGILYEIDKVYEKKIGYLNIGIRDAFKSVKHDYTLRALKSTVQALSCKLGEKLDLVQQYTKIDGLTSLKNKASYLERITEIDNNIDEYTNFSVAEFDICGLKKINDIYGHQYGDMIIVDTANLLRHVFGADNVYRFGSDEFIGIFNDISEPELRELFVTFEENLTTLNNMPQRQKVHLYISKGLATFYNGKDSCYNDVRKRANKEMYNDKANFYTSRGDRRKGIDPVSRSAEDNNR